MTTSFVLDASTTLSWAFDDEDDVGMQALDALDVGAAFVPALWPFEVANGLAVGLRRGRISASEVSTFLDELSLLDIRIDGVTPSTADLVDGTIDHEVTTYDASYLLLAERSGLPLATCDRRMQEAARRCGVPLLTGP